MMLGFMQLLTFLTPPEAGEKISLSITILLSFTVFVLMISEMMPTTSISVPLLGKSILYTFDWKYVLDAFFQIFKLAVKFLGRLIRFGQFLYSSFKVFSMLIGLEKNKPVISDTSTWTGQFY